MIASKNQIIDNARHQGRTTLTEIESKQLIAEAGFHVIVTKQAASKQEAQALSDKIGYPVVLKVDSAHISHKSDAGGVKVGLKDAEEVAVAYDQIMVSAQKAFPDAKVDGVSVQRMARSGIEIIMGMFKDVQFGPVLMFGLGGILVEVLKDVVFRVVPLAKRDAREMIKEIKGYKLLEGYRSQEPANINLLEEMLLKLSEFVDKTPEIKEIDFNPVFAYQDGAVVVDARIGLEEK